MIDLKYLLTSVAIISMVSIVPAEAQYDDLPQTGTLAGSRSGGYGGTSLGGWGDEEAGPPPIAASVSRDGRNFMVRVFNNAEDQFRVSIEVVQYNDRSKRLKGTNMSFSLKPGQSAERSVSSAPGAVNSEVKLKNWKKVGGRKSSDNTLAEIERKRQELRDLEQSLIDG